MEPFHVKKSDVELGCHIDDSGVIQMKLKGNFSSDHLEDFKAWCEAVKQAMKVAYKKDPKRVLSIIDVTGGWGFDLKSLSELIKVTRHNRQYATRTGVFGASKIMRSFMVIARMTAHRDNIKAFLTREDAEEWIVTGDDSEVIE